MSKVIKKRDCVILNSEEELNCVQVKHFKELLEQRLKGKPISYITGKKIFGNMSLILRWGFNT